MTGDVGTHSIAMAACRRRNVSDQISPGQALSCRQEHANAAPDCPPPHRTSCGLLAERPHPSLGIVCKPQVSPQACLRTCYHLPMHESSVRYFLANALTATITCGRAPRSDGPPVVGTGPFRYRVLKVVKSSHGVGIEQSCQAGDCAVFTWTTCCPRPDLAQSWCSI